MICPISSYLSPSCPQLYRHLRTQSYVIHLYLSMPWSRVNTKYSIHRVQHTPSSAHTKFSIHRVQYTPSTAYAEYGIDWVQHTPSTAHTEYCIHRLLHYPKINRLPLAASLSALSGPGCTQFSTFPQLRVKQWIESQLPSHMPPDLPAPDPLPPDSLHPNVSPNKLDYRFQQYLWVHFISSSKCISKHAQSQSPSVSPKPVRLWPQVPTIIASKCISTLARSWSRSASLSSLDHFLQVYLQICLITASKCISKLTWSRPQSVSPNSPDYGLQVRIQVHLQVYGDTRVTEVDRVTESIYLAVPGVDRHWHLISISSYHSMTIHTLSFPTLVLTHSVRDFMDPQSQVVWYVLTQYLCSSNQKRSFWWIPFGFHKRCGRVLMVGSLPSSSIVSAQRPPSGASLSSFNRRVQVLLWLCTSTICGQIDRMYIYRETYIMHGILWCSESCDYNKDKMPCSYVRTTAVRIWHKVSHRAVQWSRLLSKYPAELHSGLNFCQSLPQICTEVSGVSKFAYSISQISENPECSSITAGAFRCTWECSCTVWAHFAYLQGGLEASWSTQKHWWDCPESLGRLCVASGPIYIWLMVCDLTAG